MFKPPFIIPVTKGPQLWSDTMQLPATTRIELISKNELTSEQFALAMELARKEISANLGVIKRVYLGQRQNSDISNLGYVSTFTPLSDSVGLQYVRNTGAEYLTLVVKAEAFLPSKKAEPILPGLAANGFEILWLAEDYQTWNGTELFQAMEGSWLESLETEILGMGYSQVRVGVAGMQFYAATQQPSSFVYVYPSRVDELGGFFYYINTAGGWGHASLFEGDGTDYSGPEYAFKNTTLNALYDFLNTPGNWIPGSNKLIVILSNFGTTDGGLFRSKAEVERLLLATNSDTIWGALTDQFDQYRPGTSTYSLNPGKNVALFSGGGRFDAATMLATLRPKIIASAQQRPILFKKQI